MPTHSKWQSLPTEQINPATLAIDKAPVREILYLIINEDRRALGAALRVHRAVARAASLAAKALRSGGRVVMVGAGTSGRLGVLEAAECPPTFGTRPTSVRAVMAGGPRSVFRAREGAEDRRGAGRRVGLRLRPRDLLVGISASSVTPYVRGALAGARRRGATTVLVTCAPGPGLRALADAVIAIPTGPEVLTGSTRLKAGTATKAVLNAITTVAMVRLGKVYENLMVDVRPTSAKLRDRSRRIVAEAAQVSERRAARALAASRHEVKTAILVARLRLTPAAARRRLRAVGGHVRRALYNAS